MFNALILLLLLPTTIIMLQGLIRTAILASWGLLMHLLPCRSYLPTWGLSSRQQLDYFVVVGGMLFYFICLCIHCDISSLYFIFMHWIYSLCFCLFICAFISCVFSFVLCLKLYYVICISFVIDQHYILFYFITCFYSYAFLICIYYFMIYALHFLASRYLYVFFVVFFYSEGEFRDFDSA